MAVKISPAPSPSGRTLAAPASLAEQRSASGLSRPPVQTRDLQGCQHAILAPGFMSQPSAQDANSDHLTRVAVLAQRLRRILELPVAPVKNKNIHLSLVLDR